MFNPVVAGMPFPAVVAFGDQATLLVAAYPDAVGGKVSGYEDHLVSRGYPGLFVIARHPDSGLSPFPTARRAMNDVNPWMMNNDSRVMVSHDRVSRAIAPRTRSDAEAEERVGGSRGG
jgi:hypothetical protein